MALSFNFELILLSGLKSTSPLFLYLLEAYYFYLLHYLVSKFT